MHALGAGYLRAGHEFLMIVPGDSDTDHLTPFGRRVTVRSPVLPLSGGYRVITRLGHVRSIIQGFDPHALEVSDRTTLRGLGAWSRKLGVPSTFFAHERADGVIRANLPRWLPGVLPVEAMANRHNRGTAQRFTTIVCTTAYAAREFDRIGIPVATVPLGVDLEQFHPQKASMEVRAKVASQAEALLFMASRLSPEKEPQIAIDAVRALATRGIAVRLLSAGTGSLDTQMRARAADLPVTFLGFVADREEFSTLLASADVVLAPGPIETFGLAALEALASGTAVVVNAASALPEVVGDAGIAADGTGEAFADAIETLLARDPEQRRAAARARAETMPWSATVARMLELHAQGKETALR
jgi:alpha-1,6-mannosyltransferase